MKITVLLLLLAVPCFGAEKPLDVPPMPATCCSAPADVPPMPLSEWCVVRLRTVYPPSYSAISCAQAQMFPAQYDVYQGFISKLEAQQYADFLNAGYRKPEKQSPRPDGLGYCSPACSCGCNDGAPCTCGAPQTARPAQQAQPTMQYQDSQLRLFSPRRSGGGGRRGGGC